MSEPTEFQRRSGWLNAARQLSLSETAKLRCPENQDDVLSVEWVPDEHGKGGEYLVHCPTCAVTRSFPKGRRSPGAG